VLVKADDTRKCFSAGPFKDILSRMIQAWAQAGFRENLTVTGDHAL
jgi:hypothetical protein